MPKMEISLLYIVSKEWIAGSYYIENIIKALNTLNDEQKPEIVLFCRTKDDFEYCKKTTEYPYLKFREYKERSSLRKILNRIGIGKLDLGNSKFIFPYSVSNYELADNSKIIAWKPDFQEKHYPEFFSKEELEKRDLLCRKYIDYNRKIVFSSFDSKNDFDKFYPQNKNEKFVLHFAASPLDFSDVDFEKLKEKFSISRDYYFCANQFWQHKNHLTLFKAIKLLKGKGENLLLLCSGNPNDNRNPDYFPSLQKFLMENNLENYVKILGFMDRREQLCLIKNSNAIIQPSLFEGWSTIVEESKALNKFVFLSDLKVHREQMQKNACFFNPHSERDLAEKLIENKNPQVTEFDYNENIKQFGRDFLKLAMSE